MTQKTPLLKRTIPVNQSRLAALGLLLAVLGVLAFGVVAPLVGLSREYGESIEDLKFRLERLQKTASGKDALLQRLERMRAEGQNDTRYLEKNTAALASAELQTRIKQAVGDAGGELTSTQVIPERTEEQFTRIAVKVRMNGSTDVLRQVLHSFETAKPYLFIENLNIRPIRMPRNPAAKNPQIPDRLSVDFDVVGYMQAQ
jgi:general secretion pathway protein M